jgi:glycosyltransferase involved in cell wall biosynthesis
MGMLAPWVFAWLRRFHRMAAATFVPTVELADFLAASRFGNVVHLPRAVDTRLFSPTHRDETLRASWGLRSHQLAVIYVGRIAAEKNLPLAVRSFRAIERKIPGARYVWIGDGPARAALARENPDFVFAGIQRGEALARHYASADLFLFPSLTETFGNVTLEALASGLPTVAFDYGAAREHLTGASGRLVRFGETQEFIDAAGAIVGDPAAFDAMRAAARHSVAALDPRAVTAKFAAALAGLSVLPGAASSATDAAADVAARSADAPAVRMARSSP